MKDWSNKEIGKLLKKVRAAYIIKKENRFKIAAYEKASAAIEHWPTSIKELWKKGKLTQIPGVGPNIASYLDELFKTNKVKHFNQVFKGLPEAMFELLFLPGIGPKLSYKLSKDLKLKDPKKAIKQLKKAAKSGKIKVLEGFGEKSEQEVLAGIKEFKPREKKILLFMAENVANEVVASLKKCSQVIRVDLLGSLRRKCPLVRDIDIAVCSSQPEKVVECFTKYPKKTKLVEAGEHKARMMVGQYQVDLMIEPPQSYGSLLQHFTGSKNHNIHLREISQEKGLSLSEHGIKKNNKLIKFKDEKSFYNFLNMQWIPPELREDKGEIEAAQKRKIPSLVKLKDIKGDLHLHSSFSFKTSHDLGLDSMQEMAKKAQSLGYKYIAFSEHNPSVSQHNSNNIITVIKRKKDLIDKLKSSYNKGTQQKLYIFNSLEIDINPKGERNIPDKALEYLDFGIVSIHSSFKMSKEKMTQRILKAFDHPKVKILGHPTSRMLLRRTGYELDWDKIFDFCQKNKKYLEINSFYERLDLPDVLIKQAIDAGIKLAINTDSHALKEMDYMRFGVSHARRGWATKADIINTLAYNRIAKLLT